MSKELSDSREAFERELVSRIPNAQLQLRDAADESRPGEYEHATHEFAWKMWQAAIAHKSEGAVPVGWKIKREPDGAIIVQKDGVGGVVVKQEASSQREIPEEILYALADDLLRDAAPIFDECVASGQSCSYRADGPNGGMQCQYCGKEHAAPVAVPVDASFQQRVQPWMLECFGPVIAADICERNHRFFEESTELVQACGMTASEAHQLVDYVYGRDVGEKVQEVGGVMVTLAALCLAQGTDMHAAGETELARISAPETVLKIRAKQAAKPKHSPLPAAPAPHSGEAATVAAAKPMRYGPYSVAWLGAGVWAGIVDELPGELYGHAVYLVRADEAPLGEAGGAVVDEANPMTTVPLRHYQSLVRRAAAQPQVSPIGYGKKSQLEAIGENGSALLYSVACPDEGWDVPLYHHAAQPQAARIDYVIKHRDSGWYQVYDDSGLLDWTKNINAAMGFTSKKMATIFSSAAREITEVSPRIIAAATATGSEA